MIREVKSEDAEAIADIYNYYIDHTIVTFEETSIDAQEMRSRILSVSAKYPWIVYEADGEILGYAYASDWKSRCSYKHSVESTVYLKNGAGGKGFGSQLYAHLINQLKTTDIHAIIGGVSLPNPASAALHEKFGFEKIAQFKEVGYKFGEWIDVGYWELII